MGVELGLHSFLTLALEAGGWSTPRLSRFTLWEKRRRLGGPPGGDLESCGEEQISFLPEFRLPPLCGWGHRSSGLLSSVSLCLFTDVSVKTIRSIFYSHAVPEDFSLHSFKMGQIGCPKRWLSIIVCCVMSWNGKDLSNYA